MEKLRVGIIGIGNMGSSHARQLAKGEVPGAQLTAVCDLKQERLEWARSELGENISLYSDTDAFFAAGVVDAVIIAVPHYDHPVLAIEAFKRGLHVLTEKPAGFIQQR